MIHFTSSDQETMAMQKSEVNPPPKVNAADVQEPCKEFDHHENSLPGFKAINNDGKDEGYDDHPRDGPGADAVDDADSTKKGGLMKRLTSLLSKKSSTKPAAPKQKTLKHGAPAASTDHHQSKHGGGTEFELLLAQAEATLGELLVKAGRGPSLFKSASRAPAAAGTASGNGSLNGLWLSGNPSLSRRRGSSLYNRLWQQVGGKVFCGAGSSTAAMAEEMGVAPLAMSEHYQNQRGGAEYFVDGGDDDEAADEAYWQAVADAMMQGSEKKQGMGATPQHCTADAESVSRVSEIREEAGSKVPEILLSVPSSSSSVSGININSGSKVGASFDSSQYNLRKSMATARLNTRLEDSPQLLHNYSNKLLRATMAMPIDECSVSSSSVWASASSSSSLASASGTGRVRSRSSGAIDGLVAAAPSRPLQKLLSQARASSTSSPLSTGAVAASSPSPSLAAPTEGTLMAGGEQTSAMSSAEAASAASRVSLQALLYEEKEELTDAIDASIRAAEALSQQFAADVGDGDARHDEHQDKVEAPFVSVSQQRGQQQQPNNGTGAVDDPLLCCVCLVGRKGAAFIPCGHTFCRSCTKQLFAGRGACPLCNNLIVQVLDIF